MMRRFILACALLCMAVTGAMADEEINITLSNDHTKDSVTVASLCNIFTSLEPIDDESGKLTVSIENIRIDGYQIILFDKKYTEKSLKKNQMPKIIYDKLFAGTKGERETECCGDVDEMKIVTISDDKKILFTKDVYNGKQEISLPIYIAKKKKTGFLFFQKEARTLLRKEEIELHINVELKPDTDFVELSKEVSEYIAEMEKRPICKHKLHRASIEDQIDYYQKRREDLTERIKSIRDKSFTTDKNYIKYDSLCIALENINLDSPKYTTQDCGNKRLHKSAPRRIQAKHKCNYCSWTLEEIMQELNKIAIKIYNGSSVKKNVLPKVEAMYKCCTDRNCSKHAEEWRKGGNIKKNIEDFYGRIKKR